MMKVSLLIAALAAGVGCTATYGPSYVDTSRCQWVWIQDGYGGYQQLQCWNPHYAGWRPYTYGSGSYYHAYPGGYGGPRVHARPPPRFAPPVPMARPVGPGARTVVVP